MWLPFVAVTTLAVGAQTLSLTPQGQNANIIDLTSVNWTLQSRNISVPARIPSQAHLDLLEAGLIEEPTYGDNDFQQAWIAKENFTYHSSELSALNRSSDWTTHLIFDGIDTFADVSFCGQFVGSVDNQFLQWDFDITNLLSQCTSSPVIEVALRAAPLISAQLIDEEYTKANKSCIACYGTKFQFLGRQFIRKEQSDYGWDWGPGFAPQGIWQPARIVQIPKREDLISIQHIYVDVYKQNQVNNLMPDQSAPWVLNISVDYLGTLSDTSSLNTSIFDSSGGLFEHITLGGVDMQSGRITGSAVLQNKPDLWWPIGYGNQTMYNLIIDIISSSSANLGSAQQRIGFRTIVLNQTPVSSEQLAQGIGTGDNWHFEINGHEFYAKGSNLIPPDPFWPRVNRSEMEVLFKSAVAANQNMLRVWSSNIYLPEYAYDLADELGLLLWSELQFSDAFYPNDTTSIKSYVDEVTYQVRRINHHPSLALWCGGNELELALLLVSIGAKENLEAAIANYESIFLDALLHAVFDNTRSISYIASSTNYGYKSFDYNRARPIEPRFDLPQNGSFYGDSDYYNYDSSQAFDLATYPVSRFTNEFGFPSHSSYQTYAKFFPADQLSFDSSLMIHRNRHYPLNITELSAQDPFQNSSNATANSIMGLADMSRAIALYYPTPNKSDSQTNFSMQIYTTQLFQAEFVRSQIDFYRRGSGLPQRNLGSLYWQLNDIWAAPTWASLEVGGRWKLLHHVTSDAYLPVVIAPFRDPFNTLSISVTSDLWEDVNGTASLAWYDWSGACLDASEDWSFKDRHVSVGAINSTQIFNASLWTLPGHLHTAVALLRTNVTTTNGQVHYAERFYVPQALRDENTVKALVDPDLEVRYDDSSDTFTVTSHALAAYVWLDHPLGPRGYFTQNGFWMLPGTWTLKFVTLADHSDLPDGWQHNVTARSIFDLTTP